MTPLFSAAGVESAFWGGKEILPGKFARRVRVFHTEGMGKIDFAQPRREIIIVENANAFDLTFDGRDEGIRQRGDAILLALAIADRDGLVVEIDILETQPDAFHEAQSGTIEELSHEFMDAGKLVDDPQDFCVGQDGRQAFRTFGAGDRDRFDLLTKYFAIEEEDGAERLVLGGGSDVPLC